MCVLRAFDEASYSPNYNVQMLSYTCVYIRVYMHLIYITYLNISDMHVCVLRAFDEASHSPTFNNPILVCMRIHKSIHASYIHTYLICMCLCYVHLTRPLTHRPLITQCSYTCAYIRVYMHLIYIHI